MLVTFASTQIFDSILALPEDAPNRAIWSAATAYHRRENEDAVSAGLEAALSLFVLPERLKSLSCDRRFRCWTRRLVRSMLRALLVTSCCCQLA